MASPYFKQLLEQRTSVRKYTDTETISELKDKRETARLILKAAMAQDPESKERIEGLMKYSDLMGYKKEEVADEIDNINFFFPLKCNQCPLLYAYNEYLQSIGETKMASVEMPNIIEKAHPILQMARKNMG